MMTEIEGDARRRRRWERGGGGMMGGKRERAKPYICKVGRKKEGDKRKTARKYERGEDKE